MKKMLFLVILMMGTLNAKQFAYCVSSGAFADDFTGCSIKGKHYSKSIDQMYQNGWRLITVVISMWEKNSGNTVPGQSLYFFEK